jgi:hypothetical protein
MNNVGWRASAMDLLRLCGVRAKEEIGDDLERS